MATSKELLLDYLIEEFYDGLTDEAQEEERRRILREELADENLESVPVAFSQYDDGVVCVDEQWIADLVHHELYCEFNYDKKGISYKFDTDEELAQEILNLECWSFNSLFGVLIAEADDYIQEHYEEFKED